MSVSGEPPPFGWFSHNLGCTGDGMALAVAPGWAAASGLGGTPGQREQRRGKRESTGKSTRRTVSGFCEVGCAAASPLAARRSAAPHRAVRLGGGGRDRLREEHRDGDGQ